MTRSSRYYTAYGLLFRSPIDLPFALSPCSPTGEVDVTVSIDKTPERLPNPIKKGIRTPASMGRWELTKDIFLLDVPGIARYLVTGGHHVTVDPYGDALDCLVGVYLAGMVSNILLQQRDIITFHASSIMTETGAVLFTGPSGSGKSTLLAALLNRGYSMLSDDISGIVLDADGGLTVLPSFSCIRLQADTLKTVGWRRPAQTLIWEGRDKYTLRVEGSHSMQPTLLRSIYILTRKDIQDVRIERLTPLHAFKWLIRRVYKKRILVAMGHQRQLSRTLGVISKTRPVSLVERPTHPFLLDTLADRIDMDLRGEPLPAGNDAAAGQAASRSVAGG